LAAPLRRLLLLVPTPREAELLLGPAAHGLAAPRLATVAGRSVRVALTGFGLAAAGASSGRWFAKVTPDAALLVGIAGTLDVDAFPIGSVMEADSVSCDGIGAGEGDRFVALPEPPLPGALVGDAPLAPAPLARRLPDLRGGELVSVAAAAGSRSHAQARRARHPGAVAEEMEGYAVALAARLAGVPLTILRGASNEAGDRDHRLWQVAPALAACRKEVERWVESSAAQR